MSGSAAELAIAVSIVLYDVDVFDSFGVSLSVIIYQIYTLSILLVCFNEN